MKLYHVDVHARSQGFGVRSNFGGCVSLGLYGSVYLSFASHPDGGDVEVTVYLGEDHIRAIAAYAHEYGLAHLPEIAEGSPEDLEAKHDAAVAEYETEVRR